MSSVPLGVLTSMSPLIVEFPDEQNVSSEKRDTLVNERRDTGDGDAVADAIPALKPRDNVVRRNVAHNAQTGL
jgi:hypothetical protein